jgi:hypothetical protein
LAFYRLTSAPRFVFSRRAFSRHALLAFSGALLASASARPSSLHAQTVAGLGDDAIPLPKGSKRFLISGLWNDWDAVYTPAATGGSTRRPLLGALATSNAGVAIFPQLASTEAGLRTLTGQSSFALSLGALDATGEVRQSIAPLGVSLGLTRRLSLRLLVPYVESRDVSQLLLNRVGSTANVGMNPAYAASTGVAARSTNGALLSQLDLARTRLTAEITRCASTTATGCDAIRANVGAAQALLIRAGATRTAIAAVYGDAKAGGAPVVPIANGSAQAAVRATIATLRTDFATFGVTNIVEGAAPAGASTIYGPGGISRIVGDTAWKLSYGRVGNTRRAGIGDIDLTASYLLFDSFQADQVRRLLTPSRGVRSMLTAGWRFGTAGADRTDDPFDVPIGDGANALLVRSTTDLVLSRSFWMSATARAVKPLSDEIAVALPLRSDANVFDTFAVRRATRSLGTRVELEVAPRWSFGQFFGISAAYLVRRWGADRYDDGDPASSTPLRGDDAVPSRTMHAAAFGASFSTLASYMRGRSRFPAEVIYSHTIPVAGSGGTTPASTSDRLELRVYTGFPRR